VERIAYFDVAVRDRRSGRAAAFSLPLAAEHSRPNDLGYLAATMVAEEAWARIAPRLADFLAAAVQKAKAEQAPSA
jgi:hypothetical protein